MLRYVCAVSTFQHCGEMLSLLLVIVLGKISRYRFIQLLLYTWRSTLLLPIVIAFPLLCVFFWTYPIPSCTIQKLGDINFVWGVGWTVQLQSKPFSLRHTLSHMYPDWYSGTVYVTRWRWLSDLIATGMKRDSCYISLPPAKTISYCHINSYQTSVRYR
jgi:hypothetical protein